MDMECFIVLITGISPVHLLTSVKQVRENSGPECPCRQNCAGKQKTSQCILPNFAEVVNIYGGQC
jgi:hypothetical protein